MEKKVFYQKIGGGSLRLKNKIIKPGEKFWEYPGNIPESFKDRLIILDESKKAKPKIVSEKRKYYKKHIGGGRYDIFDENGKKINEESLKKVEADKILENL